MRRSKIVSDFGAQEVRTLGDLRGATARVTGFEMAPGSQTGYVLTSDATGLASWQQVPVTGVDGGGSSGTIPKFVGGATLGNSAMAESGGNIGVGVNPLARLHVLGQSPSTPALLLQGAPGHSASLQEWRDGSGSVVASIGASGVVTGVGSGLTSLDAAALTSGTLPDTRLAGTYSGALNLSNPSNGLAGNGSALTNLNAAALASGTLPSARLSGTYSSAVTFSNMSGSGAGLTNLNASNVASGNLNAGRLPLSGTWNLTSGLAVSSGAGLMILNDAATGRVGVGSNAPQAKLHVVPVNAITKAVIVQGVSGQLANLQEWQNSSGAALGSVSPAGVLTINGSGITAIAANSITTGSLDANRLPTGGNWALSGGLNVDGSTLQIDPTNNRVGIGAAPGDKLDVQGGHVIIGNYGAMEGVYYQSSPGNNTIVKSVLMQCGEISAGSLGGLAGTHYPVGDVIFPVAFDQVLSVQLTADVGWYVPMYSALGNSGFSITVATLVNTGDNNVTVKWCACGRKN